MSKNLHDPSRFLPTVASHDRPHQELLQRVIPFVIRRFLPDNTYEDWKAHAGILGVLWSVLGPSRLAALHGELQLPCREVSELLDLE